nr:hypothetical protein [Tanacetum cinerariifolium]
MADVNAPSGQAHAMAPPVRLLHLPPPYPQFTSNNSGIQSYMTRKLDATGVSWMNSDKMADVNAPSGQAHVMAPPVRTDDQILPRIRWVPIGKSNY